MNRFYLALGLGFLITSSTSAQFGLDLADEKLKPPSLSVGGSLSPTQLPGEPDSHWESSFGLDVGQLECSTLDGTELQPYRDQFQMDQPFGLPLAVPEGGWTLPGLPIWFPDNPDQPWTCPTGTKGLSDIRVSGEGSEGSRRSDSVNESHTETEYSSFGRKGIRRW